MVSDEPINDYKLKIKLTIFNLQPQDFTEYNVTAVNSIGEASAVIKLQSKNKNDTFAYLLTEK